MQYRVQFAERFPDEDELANALANYKSWRGDRGMTVEDLARELRARGEPVARRGHGIRTRCPVCQPRGVKTHRARLYIDPGRGTPTLVYCARNECEFESIMALLPLARTRTHAHARGSRTTTGFDRSIDVPRGKRLVTNLSRANVNALLAEHAAGRLDPAPIRVNAAQLRGAGRVMRMVAADVSLIVGLRAAVGGLRTVPYGQAWAAERLGVRRDEVRNAIRALERRGVLAPAGKLQVRDEDLEHDPDAPDADPKPKRPKPRSTARVAGFRPVSEEE